MKVQVDSKTKEIEKRDMIWAACKQKIKSILRNLPESKKTPCCTFWKVWAKKHPVIPSGRYENNTLLVSGYSSKSQRRVRSLPRRSSPNSSSISWTKKQWLALMDSSSWSSSSLKSTLSFALSSCFLSSSISFAALIVWGKYFIRQHGWEFCSSLVFIFLYLLAVFHNSINMLWTLYSLQCIYIDPDMD